MRRWSAYEVSLLEAQIGLLSKAELTHVFNRSIGSIRYKAYLLYGRAPWRPLPRKRTAVNAECCPWCGSSQTYYLSRSKARRCGACRRDFYVGNKTHGRLERVVISACVEHLEAGRSIRHIANDLEISTATVAKYRRGMVTQEHCGCGRPRSHVGWCFWRQSKADACAPCTCGRPSNHRGRCKERMARWKQAHVNRH
jgi:hypothetical protein